MLLDVTSLRVEFHGRHTTHVAVHDASFSLARGNALGVVGESGSGKSACCSALLGLHAKHTSQVSGSARLDGKQLINASEREWQSIRGARIGMVFQDAMTALNPHMQIGKQLVEPLRLHKRTSRAASQRLACQWLDEVGIDDVERTMRSFPHELSGGMRQRVVIAMALIAEPEFLIADEPTTALDVSTEAQIIALLHELKQRHNLGLLFVSHDLQVVRQVCEEVLVMREGHIVERGNCDAIFTAPQHAYTRQLLAAIPNSAKPEAYRYTANSAENTLALKHIAVSYAKNRHHHRAVRDVSLHIAPGEVLGLVGESGSGKSSLARAALRLIDTDQGQITVGTTALHSLTGTALQRQRKRLQMVFQDPYASLNPRKTVFETLAEPLLIHGICSKQNKAELESRVDALLAEVELQTSWAMRYPHELSGGQRQRVAIARSLAPEPEFLIADEPVSALDVSVQAQILELLLRACSQKKIGMLFISHDLAVVRYVADRVAVMLAGEIVEHGDTETVLQSPSHAYTQRLLDAKAGLNNSRNSH